MRFHLLSQTEYVDSGCNYIARDTKLGRTVIVRRLSRFSDSEHPSMAFERLAKINSRYLTRVFEVVKTPNHVDIVFQLVQGENLHRWLLLRPRPLEDLVEIIIQTGKGLTAVHNAGLVHGNITLSSITVTPTGSSFLGNLGHVGFAHPSQETPQDKSATKNPTAKGDQTHSLHTDEPAQSEDQRRLAVSLKEGLRLAQGGEWVEKASNLRSGSDNSHQWLLTIIEKATSSRPEDRFLGVNCMIRELEKGLAAHRARLSARSPLYHLLYRARMVLYGFAFVACATASLATSHEATTSVSFNKIDQDLVNNIIVSPRQLDQALFDLKQYMRAYYPEDTELSLGAFADARDLGENPATLRLEALQQTLEKLAVRIVPGARVYPKWRRPPEIRDPTLSPRRSSMSNATNSSERSPFSAVVRQAEESSDYFWLEPQTIRRLDPQLIRKWRRFEREIDATQYQGYTLTLEGWVRVEQAPRTAAQLSIRTTVWTGRTVQSSPMGWLIVSPTWRSFQRSVKVTHLAHKIKFGGVAYGPGSSFFDSLELRATKDGVSKVIELEDMESKSEIESNWVFDTGSTYPYSYQLSQGAHGMSLQLANNSLLRNRSMGHLQRVDVPIGQFLNLGFIRHHMEPSSPF